MVARSASRRVKVSAGWLGLFGYLVGRSFARWVCHFGLGLLVGWFVGESVGGSVGLGWGRAWFGWSVGVLSVAGWLGVCIGRLHLIGFGSYFN